MTKICSICHLPGEHGNGLHCLDASEAAMEALLGNIGDKGTCSGCGAEIFWVRHKNGKKTPYTPSGLNHFVDCLKAAQFSTRAKP